MKTILFKSTICTLFSLMVIHTVGQQLKITGRFPGKGNHKLYVRYLPPGFSGSPQVDSTVLNDKGKFEFYSAYKEPVLAYISFDLKEGFEFVTDRKNVNIIPLYKGNKFQFSKIKAVSPYNKHYAAYKKCQ